MFYKEDVQEAEKFCQHKTISYNVALKAACH